MAEAIEALRDTFSRDTFDTAAGLSKEQAQTTAALQESNRLLGEVRTVLERIDASTRKQAETTQRSGLQSALNAQ